MALELIPVIEIGYNNQGIPTPDKYPYWEKLANGKDGFYAGHPQPKVNVDTNIITLDFTVEEFDEHFAPTPKMYWFHLKSHL
ncbi:hypothetical protein [Sphingobacterium multivorum]|uniref:hypothetical protein n=1 Tax=Sphingobacterium multivorum TaxID=28454 RepID=UPI0031BB1D55